MPVVEKYILKWITVKKLIYNTVVTHSAIAMFIEMIDDVTDRKRSALSVYKRLCFSFIVAGSVCFQQVTHNSLILAEIVRQLCV